MLIPSDPDAFVAEAEHHTCPFHREHPHESFAGCTCSGMYRHRPATPEERKANRDRRLREQLAKLESCVAAIRHKLGMLT